MIKWILSKFTNHRYAYIGTSNTYGTHYKCTKCGRKFYLPLEWSYMIDVKTIKGCKVK